MESNLLPVARGALASSIEVAQAMADSEDLGLSNDECESLMLVLHELRRLQAVERDAIDIVTRQQTYDAVVAERDKLRAELRRRQASEKGEVWFWQHDGNDHPESLTCQVMIRADDLRELIGIVKPAAPDITLLGIVRQQRDAAREGQQVVDWCHEETAQRLLSTLTAIHEPAGVLFQHDETGRTTFVDKHDAESFEYANDRWSRVGEAALIRAWKEPV